MGGAKKRPAATSAAAWKTAACSAAPSKALATAACSDASTAGDVVEAFLSRYGFKLPASSRLGAEMARIVAASQKADALHSRMDAAPTMRMSTFTQAKKFLVRAEKGVPAQHLSRWAAQFRWRAGADLKPSSLLQALKAKRMN